MGQQFKFKCTCGRSLKAESSMSGKRAKCPNCAKILRIPEAPAPMAPPDELGLAPLDDLKGSAKPASRSASSATSGKTGKAQTAQAHSTTSASGRGPSGTGGSGTGGSGTGGSGTGASAAATKKAKSIWDEAIEDEEYRLQQVQESPCPKCGASMSSEAVLCTACGFNRQSGETVATQVEGNLSRKKRTSLFGWFSRKRGKSESSTPWRLCLGMLIIGGAILGVGIAEKSLADASSEVPEAISLEQLVRRGANGNPNLILTDFQLCPNFVYMGKGVGEKVIGSWTAVWVPAIASNTGDDLGIFGGSPQNPRVLIYSSHVKNEAELVQKLQVAQLRGMVTNRIKSMKQKEKELLRRGYPNIDFDSCIIFDEGRTPTNSLFTLLMIVGGGGAVLVSIFLMIRGAVFG